VTIVRYKGVRVKHRNKVFFCHSVQRYSQTFVRDGKGKGRRGTVKGKGLKGRVRIVRYSGSLGTVVSVHFVTVKNCRLGSTSIHVQYNTNTTRVILLWATPVGLRPTGLRPVLLLLLLLESVSWVLASLSAVRGCTWQYNCNCHIF